MRGQVEPSNEHSAWLYSQHVLASDDEFGAQAGLVVQGDELAWTTIDVLFDFATFGHAEHVRQCHADGEGSQLCTACQKAEPLGQIWLVSCAINSCDKSAE
jgi:hypothetical protein